MSSPSKVPEGLLSRDWDGRVVTIANEAHQEICQIKGSLLGRTFKVKDDQKVLAEIHQGWAGVMNEVFSTADKYTLTFTEQCPNDLTIRLLVLAGVIFLDTIYKT